MKANFTRIESKTEYRTFDILSATRWSSKTYQEHSKRFVRFFVWQNVFIKKLICINRIIVINNWNDSKRIYNVRRSRVINWIVKEKPEIIVERWVKSRHEKKIERLPFDKKVFSAMWKRRNKLMQSFSNVRKIFDAGNAFWEKSMERQIFT